MFSLFEAENEGISVQELLKRFKIKWKSKPSLDDIKCPHCRKIFKLRGEEGLEELLYAIDPKLSGLTENSVITQEIYDVACCTLRNDGLER
jgi:hypothetical protein